MDKVANVDLGTRAGTSTRKGLGSMNENTIKEHPVRFYHLVDNAVHGALTIGRHEHDSPGSNPCYLPDAVDASPLPIFG